MDSIIDYCRNIGNKNISGPNVAIENDVLCIDCRSCMRVPEIKSQDCIRCIAHCISTYGNTECIRLRTSRDMEISGQAIELLCELSFLDRSAHVMNRSEADRACAGCEYSCMNIFNVAWQGFPEPFFDAARSRLMSFRAEDPNCSKCIQKTYRALDQAELGLKGISKKAALIVARGN